MDLDINDWQDDENWEEEDEWNENSSTNQWETENENDVVPISNKENRTPYESMKKIMVEKMLGGVIKEFGEMLGVPAPFDEAKLLLQYYNWNSDKATNEYFMGNQADARINAGIDAPEEDLEMIEDNEVECPCCLDDVPVQNSASLTCGHRICKCCWSDYILHSSKIKNCFKLQCPMEDCKVGVTIPRLHTLGIDKENLIKLQTRQEKFRLRDYIQARSDLQMCPAADCENIQRFLLPVKQLSDIVCNCKHVYCARCLQDGHRPCPCDVADVWIAKATSEAENMQWIVARTKKCPKCRVPIEKNQGCNHMTCKNCGHEFCWLCKGDWSSHGSATGGFYKCNIYEKRKTDGQTTKEEQAQQDAKSELERYSFYFTRYDNHIRSINQMKKTLEEAETRMGELMSKFKWKPNEASFIKEAANTIIDCRRLLAWTYPIGYYMDDKFQMRDLFHQYQKDLEVYTEHLHELAEQKLEVFKDNNKRADVINYQRVIQKYRDNLVRGIEREINPKCKFRIGMMDR